MNFFKKFKKEKGMTYVELIVVLVLIAIVVGVSLYQVMEARRDARKAVLEANAATLRNAMEMHYGLAGRYPDLSKVSAAEDPEERLEILNEVLRGRIYRLELEGLYILEVEDNSDNRQNYEITLGEEEGDLVLF